MRKKLILNILLAVVIIGSYFGIAYLKAEVNQNPVLQTIIEGAKHNSSLIKTMKCEVLYDFYFSERIVDEERIPPASWRDKEVIIEKGDKKYRDRWNKWEAPTDLPDYFAQAKGHTTLVFDGEKVMRWLHHQNWVEISNRQHSVTSLRHPRNYGITTTILPIALMLDQTSSSPIAEINLKTKGTVENHTCEVIEIKSTADEIAKYRIDPEAGFCLRKMECYKSDGRLYTLLDSVELQEFPGGIWFPVEGTMTSFGYEPDGTQVVTLRTSMKITQVEFNKEIPDSTFTLDLPTGTKVSDRRTGEEIRYVVGEAP